MADVCGTNSVPRCDLKKLKKLLAIHCLVIKNFLQVMKVADYAHACCWMFFHCTHTLPLVQRSMVYPADLCVHKKSCYF